MRYNQMNRADWPDERLYKIATQQDLDDGAEFVLIKMRVDTIFWWKHLDMSSYYVALEAMPMAKQIRTNNWMKNKLQNGDILINKFLAF